VDEVPAFKPFDTVPFPADEARIVRRAIDCQVPSLETVIKDLYDSEITAGVQSYHPNGLRVWIGDQLNGLAASAHIAAEDAGWLIDGTAAMWLHEAAVRLYPTSEYAQRFVVPAQT